MYLLFVLGDLAEYGAWYGRHLDNPYHLHCHHNMQHLNIHFCDLARKYIRYTQILLKDQKMPEYFSCG